MSQNPNERTGKNDITQEGNKKRSITPGLKLSQVQQAQQRANDELNKLNQTLQIISNIPDQDYHKAITNKQVQNQQHSTTPTGGRTGEVQNQANQANQKNQKNARSKTPNSAQNQQKNRFNQLQDNIETIQENPGQYNKESLKPEEKKQFTLAQQIMLKYHENQRTIRKEHIANNTNPTQDLILLADFAAKEIQQNSKNQSIETMINNGDVATLTYDTLNDKYQPIDKRDLMECYKKASGASKILVQLKEQKQAEQQKNVLTMTPLELQKKSHQQTFKVNNGEFHKNAQKTTSTKYHKRNLSPITLPVIDTKKQTIPTQGKTPTNNNRDQQSTQNPKIPILDLSNITNNTGQSINAHRQQTNTQMSTNKTIQQNKQQPNVQNLLNRRGAQGPQGKGPQLQ